eukprot:3979888-Pyramimonas_sp.AAC.1
MKDWLEQDQRNLPKDFECSFSPYSAEARSGCGTNAAQPTDAKSADKPIIHSRPDHASVVHNPLPPPRRCSDSDIHHDTEQSNISARLLSRGSQVGHEEQLRSEAGPTGNARTAEEAETNEVRTFAAH